VPPAGFEPATHGLGHRASFATAALGVTGRDGHVLDCVIHGVALGAARCAPRKFGQVTFFRCGLSMWPEMPVVHGYSPQGTRRARMTVGTMETACDRLARNCSDGPVRYGGGVSLRSRLDRSAISSAGPVPPSRSSR